MKKVMVFGTFDIIHKGHIHMLKEAKEYGDFLVAVVARDKNVQIAKSKTPKNTEENRLKNMKKIKIIDKVILGDKNNKFIPIIKEKPNIIALGYDQQVNISELTNNIPENCRIVKLQPYMPEVYKSSKFL